jgi:HEAT repeat protein
MVIDILKSRSRGLPRKVALSFERNLQRLKRLGVKAAADIAALIVDRNKSTRTRLCACWALARVPFAMAPCYFVAAFDDEPTIVWEAAKGIIARRELSLVPIFISLLTHGRRTLVRAAAAYVLGHLRDRRASPALLKVARSVEGPTELRDYAIEALTYLREPRAVEIAEAALISRSIRLRLSAIHALSELGTKKSAALLSGIVSRAGRTRNRRISVAAREGLIKIAARHG